MYQRWILGFSLAAGAVLFGLAIRIQTDRFAFTSPARELDLPAPRTADLVVPTRVESAKTVEADSTLTPTLFMPPVEIRGERRATVPRALPAAPVTEASEPCSPWREIGPARVENGEPIGMRHVRELC